MNTTYGIYTSYFLQHNHFAGGSSFNYAWVGGLAVASALVVAPVAKAVLRWAPLKSQFLMGESSPVGEHELR
jgi:hypothetical protein